MLPQILWRQFYLTNGLYPILTFEWIKLFTNHQWLQRFVSQCFGLHFVCQQLQAHRLPRLSLLKKTGTQAQSKKLIQQQTTAKALSDQAFASYEKNQIATALRLFKRAADLGDNSSKYNLAVIVLTDESALISKREALRYLHDAGKAGFGLAQFMLGRHYEQGQYVKASKEIAFSWYEKAAQNGITDAFLELATAYYLGRGAPQDYSKALQWYEKSAESGDGPAQYLTASMYETGLGVPIDLDAALQWYSAAARQGDQAAQFKAKELANRIANEQSKSRS